MPKNEDIFQSLITGGIIGAALGALLAAKNKEEGAALGALAGAAILATFKANEIARQGEVPFYIEEKGSIYEVQPGGNKVFIKKIPKESVKVPKHFKIK